MREIEGEQVLMRIFLGHPRAPGGPPLHRRVLELLRAEGLAGATVLKGIAAFGHDRHVHTANIEVLADGLPLVVEVVDSPERLERVVPKLQQIMEGGVIMTERAKVIRYAPGSDRRPPA